MATESGGENFFSLILAIVQSDSQRQNNTQDVYFK